MTSRRKFLVRTAHDAVSVRRALSPERFSLATTTTARKSASAAWALQQNIHGVVDVFGAKKPSFDALREESSPVASLPVENHSNTFRILVKARNDLPAYTLFGYRLRGVSYNEAGIPLEQQETARPDLPPGSEAQVELAFRQPEKLVRVQFDVLRPTRFSAFSAAWKP